VYGIKIATLKLADGVIVPKRNAITQLGDNATPDEADIALECANTLRKEVVAKENGRGSPPSSQTASPALTK
jgi:hypothetical protein